MPKRYLHKSKGRFFKNLRDFLTADYENCHLTSQYASALSTIFCWNILLIKWRQFYKLSTYNGWMKFTVEIHRGEDGSGRLSTVWYPKPTATKRMINFYSNNARTKLSCVQGLINRDFRLTTKPGI
jgi:hypothetical protein